MLRIFFFFSGFSVSPKTSPGTDTAARYRPRGTRHGESSEVGHGYRSLGPPLSVPPAVGSVRPATRGAMTSATGPLGPCAETPSSSADATGKTGSESQESGAARRTQAVKSTVNQATRHLRRLVSGPGGDPFPHPSGAPPFLPRGTRPTPDVARTKPDPRLSDPEGPEGLVLCGSTSLIPRANLRSGRED